MGLDDYMEPEVLIAVAVTAAVASPPVRKVLRKGLVYGLAGLLKVGDTVAASARTVVQQARHTVAADGSPAGEPAGAAAGA
jgi:hypothetical protein